MRRTGCWPGGECSRAHLWRAGAGTPPQLLSCSSRCRFYLGPRGRQCCWVAGGERHPLLCCRLFAACEFNPPAATGLVGAGLGPWTSGFRWQRRGYIGGPGRDTAQYKRVAQAGQPHMVLLSPPGRHESHAGREPITESQRDEKLIKELLKSNKYWKSYCLCCLCSRFH